MNAVTLAVAVPGALAASAAGAWAWRRSFPVSFWYGAAFPARAILVYLAWGHVASGCGLSARRRRMRWTLDAVPVMSSALRGTNAALRTRRRLHYVDVDRAPRIGLLRPTALGWRVRVRLNNGQIPGDYAANCERLAHAWRVHAVRVVGFRPGQVTLMATMRDPLASVQLRPVTGKLLTVRVGMLENGQPWLIDLRMVPHHLIAGATQSGKSTLANTIIAGLAPQPVALVGIDLKGGVEFTPYAARLSALATTRTESVGLLEDLQAILAARMRLCRERGARNIWQLPAPSLPVPIVVLVDEVAELYLIADKSEKDEVAATSTGLLRIAQLGRAFGVYLIVCGQRIGSDLGPGVTALRAQLSGRVCHRVNDPETANMTLGDMDPDALDAARQIPADMPGVAIVATSDGAWHRARSAWISEAQAEQAARDYAHLTPSWDSLTSPAPVVAKAAARQAA
jgi:FtsK/SpoIIIE family